MNAEMMSVLFGSDPRDDFSHSMREMVILKITKSKTSGRAEKCYFFQAEIRDRITFGNRIVNFVSFSNGTILSLGGLNWQNEYDVSVDCVDIFMNYLHKSNALLILLASSMFRNRLNRIG